MQTKDIVQELVLQCSPKDVFDAWMDSNKHGEIIHGNAVIDPKVGGKFDIWDGYAIGKTIELDPTKLKIVQEWRDDSTDWPEGYYSTITLEFHPYGSNQTKLNFTQIGIPAEHAKSIEKGWNDYYWQPMKEFFSK